MSEQTTTAAADQLTPEEVAEYRQLRQAQIEREQAEAKALEVAQAKLTKPTHYVRLADGEVLQLAGGNITTHHTIGDSTGRPDGDTVRAVVSAHEIL